MRNNESAPNLIERIRAKKKPTVAQSLRAETNDALVGLSYATGKSLAMAARRIVRLERAVVVLALVSLMQVAAIVYAFLAQ